MNERAAPVFGLSLDKLVRARALVAKTDERMFDFLCGFRFAEGVTVVRLSLDRTHIVFDPVYVESAPLGELVVMLKGIASQAMP